MPDFMTKPYLEKSVQSMQVAELLVKQNYCSSSVNRAYYSCLQFVFHILYEKLGLTKEEVDQAHPSGTHSKAQYLLEIDLAKKNISDFKWFQAKFPALKMDRVIADYTESPMNSDNAYNAINQANAIINLLKRQYR